MSKISVVIITLNEELCIGRAIESASQIAEEIIIVDSGSTDKTLEIIKSYDIVKVFHNNFIDFSSQKNFAISKASCEWIFVLDADEYFDKNLENQLKSKLFKNEKIYASIRKNWFMDGWLSESFGKDMQHRLFERKKENIYQNKVHERLKSIGNLEIIELEGCILHEQKRLSINNIISKQIKYTDYDIMGKYKNASLFLLLSKSFFKLINTLILKRIVFKGKRNILWAFVIFSYDLLLVMKKIEIDINNKGKS
ncbi:MAG: hypothetical protein COA99_19545 [Moraxellaceae bacterium]|nr:MAG: hypothetical protein COA99_19545 [Moraxellaceae bacterium]